MSIIKKNSTIHLKVKPVHYEGEMTERNFFETFGRLTFKEIESWLTGVDGVSSVLDTFSDEEEWRKRYWEMFDAKTYRKSKHGSMKMNIDFHCTTCSPNIMNQ